jgi:hypothetical protein
MIIFFALQFTLPLLLIILMAMVPSRSYLGFGIQVLATVALLLAASLIGIWMLPPWWTPYVFSGLLLIAIFVGVRRRRPFKSVIPMGVLGWTVATLYLGLGVVALITTISALSSRTPSSAELVELTFPLDRGTYLVLNGGSRLSTNAHLKTLDTSIPRFYEWRGQSYGVDLVQLDGFGLRVLGVQPSDPKLYQIYGVNVLAPCAGEIVVAVDGLPDMRVPETDRNHMAGNHVIVRCGTVDVILGHFQPRSIQVSIGTRVNVGDPLARVGNSGNTDEPHLHIHAQRPGTGSEPLSGDPLPIRLSGRFLVRNDRVSVP